jgi:hypothetical protein
MQCHPSCSSRESSSRGIQRKAESGTNRYPARRDGATRRGTSSITVRIERAGSAPGDRLPEMSDYGPTEPGPAGIRFAPGNVAEFAVDGRACDMQVVTDVQTDADRPTAARMIGLVRDRL